jgi:ribosomal protein S27E
VYDKYNDQEVTGYVYNSVDDPHSQTIHCINCGRTLMVVKGRLLVWATSSGKPYEKIETRGEYVSHICHNCHTTYSILLHTSESGRLQT